MEQSKNLLTLGEKHSSIFFLYYIVLLLLLVTRPEGAGAPNIIFRVGYMLLLIVPAIFLRDTWLPAVMTCVITVSQYGFAYSYLPYDNQHYIIVLLLSIFVFRKNELRLRLPKAFVILLAIFFLNELVISSRISTSFLGAFVTYLIVYFVNNDNHAERKMSIAFIIASFTLSLLYIFFRDRYLVDYSFLSGLERADWVDPNYFSMAIGMGAIVALSMIYDKGEQLIIKMICILTLITAIMSIALLASRGGLLSFGVASLVIVLFSRGRIIPKVITIIAIVLFVIYLFNNDYFELVLYRFENDIGGGSGRVAIWERKLAEWNNSSIFELLLGRGFTAGVSMTGKYVGFHNDFLAMLVECGVVGFLLFIYLLVWPIRNIIVYKRNVISVSAFLVYLILECLNLEPLTLGRIPFWMFFMFIILLSEKKGEKTAIKDKTHKRIPFG